MKRALLFATFAALGCQPEMSDMMGGDPMDASEWDMPGDMPDGGMPDFGPLRINHLQLRGTNNSYHTVDHDFDRELLGYIHLPIAEQAEEQGIRFFDFDLNPDRESGLVLEPGVSDWFDADSTCPTWYECMRAFAPWMQAHPRHAPVVFFVGETWLFATTPGLHFQLDDLERAIVRHLGRDRILTPADVLRGRHETLREAIEEEGWPTVEDARGKAMFVLNDRALARERYIERGGQNADDRLLFLIGDPDSPDDDEVVFTFEPEFDGDPWYFETEPTELDRIRELARAGNLVHGVSDDPEMIANLRAAGAHFVGTRFPERLGEVPPEGPVACNPVTRAGACDPVAIEPRR